MSHGSPMIALDRGPYGRALGAWAGGRVRPAAIVVVSAHWVAPGPIRVGASERPLTIHDFGGFPDELDRLNYPAPGSPAAAADVVARLGAEGLAATLDPRRGLDHGAWVPLRFLYPDADVPVVPVSLPRPRSPEELVRLGRALAPLRDRGILILGSGGVVHNLRRVVFHDPDAPVENWAREFDDWVATRVLGRDVEGLAGYRATAPFAPEAVPTTEHLDPLLVGAGATAADEPLATVYEGFQHGNLSLRCFASG